jgi:hypothetical protein
MAANILSHEQTNFGKTYISSSISLQDKLSALKFLPKVGED